MGKLFPDNVPVKLSTQAVGSAVEREQRSFYLTSNSQKYKV